MTEAPLNMCCRLRAFQRLSKAVTLGTLIPTFWVTPLLRIRRLSQGVGPSGRPTLDFQEAMEATNISGMAISLSQFCRTMW